MAFYLIAVTLGAILTRRHRPLVRRMASLALGLGMRWTSMQFCRTRFRVATDTVDHRTLGIVRLVTLTAIPMHGSIGPRECHAMVIKLLVTLEAGLIRRPDRAVFRQEGMTLDAMQVLHLGCLDRFLVAGHMVRVAGYANLGRGAELV